MVYPLLALTSRTIGYPKSTLSTMYRTIIFDKMYKEEYRCLFETYIYAETFRIYVKVI